MKQYPAWVNQGNKPELTRSIYDVVIKLFDEAAAKIKANTSAKTSEITLSQAKVCQIVGIQRVSLKNYKYIQAFISESNTILEKQLAAQQGKNLTKMQIGKV